MSADGHATMFIAPGADGSWGTFAVGADGAHGAPWVTTAALSLADAGASELRLLVPRGVLRG